MIAELRKRVQGSQRYRWYALATVMLGTVMGPLDGSIANVAVPTIGRAFHATPATVQWVLLSYLLMLASTLVLFGRLGDLIGQKNVYLVGFCIFGIGSLSCALAPSLGFLIGARVFQGIGASMLVSCSQAIITNVFPTRERGKAIGFNGAAVALGLSSGPLVGGAIVTFTSWHWIFLINVPISIIALALAAFVLKLEEGSHQRFDFPGAILSMLGLFGISLALSRAHVWGWGSAATIGVFIGAAIALGAFIFVEPRMKQPMLDFNLFENRTFAFSVIAAFLYFVGTSSIIFTVPLTAQLSLHASPLTAGLLLLPLSAINVILAPIAGAISDRVPARVISTVGAAIFAIGAIHASLLPNNPAPWMIALSMIFCGCGASVFTQPNNSTIMGAAPRRERGVASGILGTARTAGQLLGFAMAGAIYFGRQTQLGALAHTFVPAKSVFAVVAALLIIVALISVSRGTAATTSNPPSAAG